MTTATETQIDPYRQSTDEYGRSGLEAPAGVFKLRLVGNLGKGESTKEGSLAKYINLRFQIVQQANYDPATGILNGESDPRRRVTFFQKYYITKADGTRNDFAVEQLNSWLHAVGYSTKGEFNAATQQYDFDMDEALSATIDKEAWTEIKHKQDPGYGWQIDLSGFAKKPRYRIKVTNGETA